MFYALAVLVAFLDDFFNTTDLQRQCPERRVYRHER